MGLKRKKAKILCANSTSNANRPIVCMAILKSFNILFLGFSKGADPGMPELTLMK